MAKRRIEDTIEKKMEEGAKNKRKLMSLIILDGPKWRKQNLNFKIKRQELKIQKGKMYATE